MSERDDEQAAEDAWAPCPARVYFGRTCVLGQGHPGPHSRTRPDADTAQQGREP